MWWFAMFAAAVRFAVAVAVASATAGPAAASQFIDRGATGARLSVTPATQPGPFDPTREAEANAEQSSMRDRPCRPN